MQIKSTVSYCLTCVRMAIINKIRNNKCLQGCGEKGTLMHCWWKIDATTVEDNMEAPQKIKNRNFPGIPVVRTPPFKWRGHRFYLWSGN